MLTLVGEMGLGLFFLTHALSKRDKWDYLWSVHLLNSFSLKAKI